MNHATIPFLLTLAIVWVSMGVVGSRYIALVRDNERAGMIPPVVIADPSSKKPRPEPLPEHSGPTSNPAPGPTIDPPPSTQFANSRFFDLLKDEEWRQGNVIVVLISNVMENIDRERLIRQIDQIRKDHPGRLVGQDVFVVGRDRVWLSSDWLRKAPLEDAFENGVGGFVASFKQVEDDLDEVDRRRPANPARRLVLWQSVLCPRSLEAGQTPRVHRAQIIWSGGQFSEPGQALDDVFGKDDRRVTTHGPLLDSLANTVKNVLRSPEPPGATR